MTETEIKDKRANEDKVCTLMIQVYCHGAHKTKRAMKSEEELCLECRELANYVHERVARCPFMATKTFCSMCKVHCYKPEKREQIRKVMRYSGPRMLLYHPVLAVKHVALTIQEKRKLSKQNTVSVNASETKQSQKRTENGE